MVSSKDNPKQVKCKECGTFFDRARSLQIVCSVKCASDRAHSQIVKEKAKAELNGLETQSQLLQNQLEGVRADKVRYFANEATIKRNGELNEQIKSLEVDKKEIEKEIKDTNRQILLVTGTIGSIESFIKTTKDKMDEVKELENKNTLYTYYLDAVKKDGVPYELISKAMPVIENEVNNILAQVVDFSLSMDTDGKNINAKIVYEDQLMPGVERINLTSLHKGYYVYKISNEAIQKTGIIFITP